MAKTKTDTRSTLVSLSLAGLHCAGCTARVESALRGVPGVLEAQVELAGGRARVILDRAEAGIADLVAAVEKAGYRAYPVVPGGSLSLGVGGMTCASCAASVEKALGALPGIDSVSVNLASERALVSFTGDPPSEEKLREAVEGAGYSYLGALQEGLPDRERERRDVEMKRLRRELAFAAVLAAVVAAIEMGHMTGLTSFHLPALLFALTLLLLAVSGRRFFAGALAALRRRTADMNTLVAVGVGSAFLISAAGALSPGTFTRGGMEPPLYFDTAAVIVTLILLGRYLEARARGRASDAVRKLLDLSPRNARLLSPEGPRDVPAGSLRPGDLLLMRPGEQVPVDGEVTEGRSQVNEAMLTGESLPVSKTPGSPVYAGTLNTLGSFTFRAVRVGSETTLARVIRLVEQAQGSKAPIQRLADRVAAVFVPWVIAIAFVSFLLWLALGPRPSLTHAFTVFASVLLISCPCAMGLATPTAVMVGTGRGAQAGVLFRDAGALETLSRVQAMALDKTGTLTSGKLTVTDLLPAEGVRPEDLLQAAASLEKHSEHPLGEAVVAEAKRRGLSSLPVEGFAALPGRGVEGTVGDRATLAGRRLLMEERGVDLSSLEKASGALADDGKSVVFVARDGKALGALGVADAPKREARWVVEALQEQGLRVVMLTGDNERTARAVGKSLLIDRVLSEVLPGGKAEVVRELQRDGTRVAMVGDGINDAPALAQADVGLAMGGGTDVALETAGVTLMGSDLSGILKALDLSRRTMRTIRQNLFWAFAYNVAMIPVAAGVLYPFTGLLLQPIFAAGAMAFSSLFVVTNSLRLARWGRK